MRVTDAQVPTLILPEAFTITRNVGELESKGLELEVAATPVNGLEVAWNGGYTDAAFTRLEIPGEGGAENMNGNRKLFTPEGTSMVSAQYTYTPPSSPGLRIRSEEHTYELQSIMRNSYTLFYLKKK